MENSIDIKINEDVKEMAPTIFVMAKIVQDVYISQYAVPTLEETKKNIITKWMGVTEDQLDSYPLIQAYREMQKQLGGNPAEMLPAVEGLLRRGILKGRFPQINSVVDSANIVSVSNLIPIGLFDYGRIVGDVELRLAQAGDKFIPIGKDKPISLSPGTPILVDNEGIFSAVGSRDSVRTMITGETQTVLAFSWGIQGVEPSLVSDVLNKCAEEILK